MAGLRRSKCREHTNTPPARAGGGDLVDADAYFAAEAAEAAGADDVGDAADLSGIRPSPAAKRSNSGIAALPPTPL
jgi:hypothetical protein